MVMIIYYEYANYYDDDVEEDDNQLPPYHPLQGRDLIGELCDDILLHLIANKIEKIMTKTFCTIKDISLHEQMIKDISLYEQM